MIPDCDFLAARDLRDLMGPAKAGDRSAALQLRKAERHLRKVLAEVPPIHWLDAWAAGHGLPDGCANDLQDSALPLLSLEFGFRKAARDSAGLPDLSAVLDAAHESDAAMLAALKDAKTICRTVINQFNLTEQPAIGAIVPLGRRMLELVEVTPAGRLVWIDIDRPRLRFNSGLRGRPRRTVAR